MRLLYWHFEKAPNFGDELNAWMWPKLFPNAFRATDNRHLFLGIGTLLDKNFPGNELLPLAERITVFGTGVRGELRLPNFDNRWDFRFVRGPLSASRIGDVSPITDSAYCINLVDSMSRVEQQGNVGFMPWFGNRSPQWYLACRLAGFHYIDPCGPVEAVVARIRGCRQIVTEAMHGAIIADAFRIPWCRVKSLQHVVDDTFTDFKWMDWAKSIGLDDAHSIAEIAPRSRRRDLLSPVSYLREFESRVRSLRRLELDKANLSSDIVFNRVMDQLHSEVERFRGTLV